MGQISDLAVGEELITGWSAKLPAHYRSGLDSPFLEEIHDLFAREGGIGADHQRVDEPDVSGARSFLMRPEKVGVFRQVLRPEPGIVPPYFYESIELLYLVNAERPLALCGSKVVPRGDKQEPGIDVTVLRRDLVRVLQVSSPAEGPARPGLLTVPLTVCDNHS